MQSPNRFYYTWRLLFLHHSFAWCCFFYLSCLFPPVEPGVFNCCETNKISLRKSIGVWSFTRYHPNSAKTPSEVSDKTRHITLPDGSPYTSADFEAVDSGMSYTSASWHRSQQTRLSWARRCRSCFLHSLCIWIISNLGILSRVGKPISGYSLLMYI